MTNFPRTLPDLKDSEIVYQRLCVYSDCFDGHFIIDHDPEREGLVVASGGSGHGFKASIRIGHSDSLQFAPVLGEIIADVLQRKPNQYAHRFAWRKPTSRVTDVARKKSEEEPPTNLKSKL